MQVSCVCAHDPESLRKNLQFGSFTISHPPRSVRGVDATDVFLGYGRRFIPRKPLSKKGIPQNPISRAARNQLLLPSMARRRNFPPRRMRRLVFRNDRTRLHVHPPKREMLHLGRRSSADSRRLDRRETLTCKSNRRLPHLLAFHFLASRS